MKNYRFVVLIWIFFFQAVPAQTIKTINLESGDKLINQGVNINIDFTSEKKPWCGLRVDWGNGKSQPVRVGHDGEEGAPTSPIKLSNVYNSVGKYNITVKGELLIRGLTGTAMPCEVKTSATEVVVIDPANEIAIKEKERQSAVSGEQKKPVEQKANEVIEELPLLGKSSDQEAKKIQTVVADGFGIDLQSAQQNAAQNALTDVVGSFIDVTNLLEKRTEIRDGIRNQTTNIKKDIKEYSQGTIQKIEILAVANEGTLTKVTAKVSVRIDDFRAYIKKIAQGEVAVDQGLFAQAAVARKQGDNRAGLLIDNILKPLTNGDVVDFQVTSLEPFININYKGGNRTYDEILRFHRPESIFILKVRASLKTEFMRNMTQTLQSISKNKLDVRYERSPSACVTNPMSGNPNLDLTFFSSDMVVFDRNTSQYTSKSQNAVGYLIEGMRLPVQKFLDSALVPNLKVVILDGDGLPLQEDAVLNVGPHSTYAVQYGSPVFLKGNERTIMLFSEFGYVDGFVLPYLFIRRTNGCVWQTTEREFRIALVLNTEILKNAKKVIVKMTR